MISLKNISVGYHEEIFDSGDLFLNKGKIYALVGKNGAGKSTFLKTLSREITLLDGDIEYDGNDLSAISLDDLTHLLSFVPSRFPQMEFLRVREFVGLGRTPYLSILGKLSKRDLDLVDEALKKTHANHLADRFTSNLSDGECQLVAIARAFVQESDIILLDEPTAHLDYLNKRKVFDLLVTIAQQEGKCIIISTHDIDIAIEACDQFLMIDDLKKHMSLIQNPSKEELISLAYRE